MKPATRPLFAVPRRRGAAPAITVAIMAGVMAGLSGCNLAPPERTPTPFIAQSWPMGDLNLRASETDLPGVRYTLIFQDLRLQRLIAQALARNMDLRLAITRIAEARASYREQRAALLPTISGDARFERSRSSRDGRSLSSGTDGTATTGDTGTSSTRSGSDRTRNNFALQGDLLSWQIDLFGRVRNLTRAQYNLYLASESAARATRLTLVGNVASAYFTLGADRTQLAIAIQTRDTAKKGVELTRRLFESGLQSRDDLAQAEQIEAQAAAAIANYRAIVQQDINALRLLIGAEPDPALLPQSLEDVEPWVGDVPAGLSSAILLRRPDVIEAEFTLRAANARIGAARAAFFPTISLTSAIGFSSEVLKNLFTGDAFSWSLTPEVRQTIFDGGARRAELDYARAQRQNALASYQRTVQSAFRDVSDALARHATIDAQIAADTRYVNASQTSFTLSSLRYREGIDAYLPVLDAQRALFDARSNLATDRLTRLTNRVDLYTALGGDPALNDLPLPLSSDAELGWGE